MTNHLDDEQLDDLLDGLDVGATDAAHVEACTSCGARLAALRQVALLVAAPVEPAPDLARRRAISVALAAAAPSVAAARGPRLDLRGVLVPAAALLLAIAAVAGIARSTPGDDDTDSATQSLEANDSAAPTAGGEGADAGSTSAGPERKELFERAAPAAGGKSSRLDDEATVVDLARAMSGDVEPDRTCEASMRRTLGVAGDLVGTANGSRQGEPVVVLVFAELPGRRAVVVGPACDIRLDVAVPPQG